ncbi:hypothetical protein KDA14_01560 [Candidatus Saccharibacteria bacterium]|nr:hypothetical protein [Candidatus Saccharibacteria bacterium]
MTNALAGSGYVALVLQWLVLLALYLPRFFESSLGKRMFPNSNRPVPSQPDPTVASQPPQDFVIILWMIFGIGMLGFVIYVVFVRYTSAIAKTTSHTVKLTSDKIVPIVAHKPAEKIPEKKRTRLSRKIGFWLLVVACIIPVTIAVIIRQHVDVLAGNLLVFTQSVLALMVLVLLTGRRILVRAWSLKDANVL